MIVNIASAIVLLFATCANALAAIPDYEGIYVRIDPAYVNKTSEFEHSLNQRFVDGAAIVLQWMKIQPAPNVYDFRALDKWVVKAVENDQKLSLALMAGSFTPQWLYRRGVAAVSIETNKNPQNVGGAVCSVIIVPVPWDRQFIEAYDDAVKAIANHLKALAIPSKAPGAAFDAVKIAKLSGINNTTEELRLPAGKRTQSQCAESDAQSIWIKAGFTPQKILDAWTEISADIASAFPNSILSIAIIQIGAFPAVDDDGAPTKPARGKTDVLTNKIVAKALAQYDGRLAVQWNGLSGEKPNPEVIYAGNRGAIVGWQLNQSLGPKGGTACFYPKPNGKGNDRVPCKLPRDFNAILENGLDLKGRFIEIWAPNVDEFPKQFTKAWARLRNITMQ